MRVKSIQRDQVWSAVGMWAWLLNRITGVGLLLYLFQLHVILVITLLVSGEDDFHAMLTLFMFNPVFKIVNTLLLAAFYYHSLNGLRLLLHDLGILVDVKSTKKVFRLCLFAAATLWASTAYFML